MKRDLRYLLIIFMFCILLMPLLLAFNQNQILNNEYSEFKLSNKAAFITITNDGELAANASSGTGAWNDPYILENYTINMTGFSNNAILISGTTEYFTIRNCTVFNCPNFLAAIRFNGVKNGLIFNNTLTANYNSIYFDSSTNCNATENYCHLGTTNTAITIFQSNNTRIANNILTNNSKGIMIKDSDTNTLINNTILNCLNTGIEIYNQTSSSTNNMIYNNTCNFNTYGIDMYGSASINNHIINNTIKNNTGHGIYLRYYTQYNNITNNTVKYNGLLPSFASGIKFQNTFYTKVINNTVFTNGEGISFYKSEFNRIEFNEISGCEKGINLEVNSNNNFILNNSISNNSNYGVRMYNVTLNTFANNTAFNHTTLIKPAIFLSLSSNNSIETNLIRDNYRGIELILDSDNNTITNNSISYNTDQGIYLNQADDNQIKYNWLEGNGECIYESSCTGNVFIDNDCVSAPPILDSISPNPDNDGIIELNWSDISGAIRYHVYRNISVIKSADKQLRISSNVDSNYTDIILTNGTYHYAIIAEETSNGSISNCENVTVTVFAPQEAPILEPISPDPDFDGNIY